MVFAQVKERGKVEKTGKNQQLVDLTNIQYADFLRYSGKKHSFSSNERAIFRVLCNFIRAYGRAFPSRDTIIDEVGCDMKTVSRATLKFKTCGIFRVIARFAENGRQTTNEYILKTTLSKCPPLQTTKIKIKKILSISELFDQLVRKRAKNKELVGQLEKVAEENSQGIKNPHDLVTDWVFYWKEKNPESAFTMRVWENWLRGWVKNGFDHAVYA